MKKKNEFNQSPFHNYQ